MALTDDQPVTHYRTGYPGAPGSGGPGGAGRAGGAGGAGMSVSLASPETLTCLYTCNILFKSGSCISTLNAQEH